MRVPGTHAARKGDAAEGGGGPAAGADRAARSVQWHVMSPSRCPRGGSLAIDEVAGWRGQPRAYLT